MNLKSYVYQTLEFWKKIVKNGLQPGSVLSPLLYSNYTIKLEEVVDESVKILQYADDVCLYIKNSKCIIDQVKALETVIDKVTCFLEKRGLTVAPEKCVLVVFDKSHRNQNSKLSLKIDKLDVKASSSGKISGNVTRSTTKLESSH